MKTIDEEFDEKTIKAIVEVVESCPCDVGEIKRKLSGDGIGIVKTTPKILWSTIDAVNLWKKEILKMNIVKTDE